MERILIDRPVDSLCGDLDRIIISLFQRDTRFRIEIRGRGVGFEATAVHENRVGIEGIRERARPLGGKCRNRSKLGNGTSVVVDLPIVSRERENE